MMLQKVNYENLESDVDLDSSFCPEEDCDNNISYLLNDFQEHLCEPSRGRYVLSSEKVVGVSKVNTFLQKII